MIQIGKNPITLAEREGFEPSVPVTQYARLAMSFPSENNRPPARLVKTKSIDKEQVTAPTRSKNVRRSLVESHSVREVFPTLTPPQTEKPPVRLIQIRHALRLTTRPLQSAMPFFIA